MGKNSVGKEQRLLNNICVIIPHFHPQPILTTPLLPSSRLLWHRILLHTLPTYSITHQHTKPAPPLLNSMACFTPPPLLSQFYKQTNKNEGEAAPRQLGRNDQTHRFYLPLSPPPPCLPLLLPSCPDPPSVHKQSTHWTSSFEEYVQDPEPTDGAQLMSPQATHSYNNRKQAGTGQFAWVTRVLDSNVANSPALDLTERQNKRSHDTSDNTLARHSLCLLGA